MYQRAWIQNEYRIRVLLSYNNDPIYKYVNNNNVFIVHTFCQKYLYTMIHCKTKHRNYRM